MAPVAAPFPLGLAATPSTGRAFELGPFFGGLPIGLAPMKIGLSRANN